MAHVSTSIEIRRSPAEVFAYLTDPRNAKDWTTGLVDVTYDGDLGLGSSGSDTRRIGRKDVVMPWTVTSYQAPSRIVFEYSRPIRVTADFSFRAVAGGTRVTCTNTLRPTGLWRLLGPLLTREGRKTDAVQFENARRILEADLDQPDPARRTP